MSFCSSKENKEKVRCKKCLELGHWTYECTGKRKHVVRESRSKALKKSIKLEEEKKILEAV